MDIITSFQDSGIRFSTDSSECLGAAKDWTHLNSGHPIAVVYPISTEEVSKILKICSEFKVAVVPSGGRTGLAGGACSQGGDVVLSLEKMDKIHGLDTFNLMIDVDAGAITQNVQQAAHEKGLMFALDLAAKGSCQIGGNIATNAGGLKFIAHGGAKEQVLGLEVVLMDGRILKLGHGLRKNNTGYDLKSLFIGSEGTLGIVTRAQLRLVTPPKHQDLVCFGLESFSCIETLLRECCAHGLPLAAFEFFTLKAHEITMQVNGDRIRSPFHEKTPFYVLLESSESADLESIMEKGFSEGWLMDGVMASSSEERTQLWDLRESITESLAVAGQVHKNDVSVRLNDLPEFVAALEEIEQQQDLIQIILFGHIGDGNIHINYLGPKDMAKEEFNSKVRQLELQVFQKIKDIQGSISAEHGVGLLKKRDLEFSRTPEEINLMREIKKIFDPNNLLNPGKIFDIN